MQYSISEKVYWLFLAGPEVVIIPPIPRLLLLSMGLIQESASVGPTLQLPLTYLN